MLVLLVFAAAQIVPFGAALGETQTPECRQFRYEGTCPAARRVMWITGALALLALAGAWRLSRRQTA
ncbi:hypothetical protein MAA8898_04181 [Maliponia aquimaris]|uniref:Uncharacterized protein n=2 Tax=Maliponia aquimaris TaxID=1673631 RepID=A0A238L285_9RHOB|nr:hypothetical protein MAA8898_04181 [Maliponia aquimaris]